MNTVTPDKQEPHHPSAHDLEVEATLRSLRTMLEEDAQEQQETFEYLKQALDEDRPSYRRLFPST